MESLKSELKKLNSKSVLVIGGSILAFVIVLSLFAQLPQNNAYYYEEAIETAKSDISVAEKQRNDIVNNLAVCVKQYDKHEYETLMAVIESRKSGESISDAQINEINQIIDVVAEAYPELKSNEQYVKLMEAEELNENAVSSKRQTYNKLVGRYNSFCRTFPNRWFLGMTGYEKQNYERLSYEVSDVDLSKILGD